MSVFLDTSVLLKLYLPEPDSVTFENRVDAAGSPIFLSALTRVEFASAALKKARVGTISMPDALLVIQDFTADADIYQWIELNDAQLSAAEQLLHRHATAGLRTLDALPLAAALSVRLSAGLFLTADQRLAAIFQQEGLPTH